MSKPKLKDSTVYKLFEGGLILCAVALMCSVFYFLIISVGSDEPDEVKHPVTIETNHGIFSLVKPVSEIDDLLAYNDDLYTYMRKTLGGTVSATYSYGHYMSPSMYFTTDFQQFLDGLPLAGYGVETLDGHRGYMAVEVVYDKETRIQTSQTITFHFCCGYSDTAQNEIVAVVDKYLGVELDHEKVKNSVSQLTLGSSSIEVDGLTIEIKPDSVNGGFDHILVSLFYNDTN